MSISNEARRQLSGGDASFLHFHAQKAITVLLGKHQPHICLTKPLCSQEVVRYLCRHKQELELLLIGSGTMGVEFTEGVMELSLLLDLLYFYVSIKRAVNAH